MDIEHYCLTAGNHVGDSALVGRSLIRCDVKCVGRLAGNRFRSSLIFAPACCGIDVFGPSVAQITHIICIHTDMQIQFVTG